MASVPAEAGPPTHRVRVVAIAVLLVAASTGRLLAQTSATTEDLKRMSLEDLLRVDVAVVSRVPEPVSSVPAAIFVITQDDIRRSGVTSLPEALRLAPGVQVSRIDAGRYAVGISGFADRLARSALVLIDGRAVYSPLFAGTYWEVQDTVLADVDRIEVIRGPGGTLWGANAVNGIVNIITKDAAATQGWLVSATAGSDGVGPLTVRFGGSHGPNAHYRLYAKGIDRQPQFHPDGVNFDRVTMGQAGVRADWLLESGRALTVQGDVYGGRLGEPLTTTTYTPPYTQLSTQRAPLAGGNILARWSGEAGRAGTFQLQTFYDRTSRDEQPVGEVRDTFDVDFQQARTLASRHSFVWGAGYRVTTGRATAVPPSALTPERRTDPLYTAFVQDDIALARRRVRLIAGTKIEHNAYSGGELQPSGKVVWTPNHAHTVVWSVTRAVRTPSRVETDYTTTSLVSPAAPTFVRLEPDPAFVAEALVAYELGYRIQAGSKLYVTGSSFYNVHSDTLSTDLLTAFVETGGGPPRVILPVTFGNTLHGHSYGGEATADFRPTSRWRWTGSYTYDRIEMARDPDSADVSQEARYEGLTPRHAMSAQSSFDVTPRITFDAIVAYTSRLRFGPVPGYATATVRLGWQMTRDLEVSLVGTNLFSAHHLEWRSGPYANAEVQRAVGVRAVFRR